MDLIQEKFLLYGRQVLRQQMFHAGIRIKIAVITLLLAKGKMKI
jgi:hypothetical protein